MNVLIFKTTVQDARMVSALKPQLDKLSGVGQWNFDLTDCDKILRIVSPQLKPESAIALMKSLGVVCEELPD
jgi:hypothetical protein